MTAKHIIQGVMQWTKSRNTHQCAICLELDTAQITRMLHGHQVGMTIETLDRIQRKSAVPIETLFDWYRLPEGAVLGRITKAAPAQ